MTDTCKPQPEHAHHRRHWVPIIGDDQPEVMEWHSRWKYWCPFRGYAMPHDIATKDGWRYIGPAIPPEVV